MPAKKSVRCGRPSRSAWLRGGADHANADPGAAVIAALVGTSQENAAAWAMLMGSIALELTGTAAMMRADAPMTRNPPVAEASEPNMVAAPKEQAPSNVVALPSKVGSINIVGAKGCELSWLELFARYRRWCSDEGLEAMSIDQFRKRLDALRVEGIIRTRRRGDDVYCLGVQLVDDRMVMPKRPDPMVRNR
jgi:hypothetical protein